MNIVRPVVENYPAIAEIFNQAIVPFYEIYNTEEKQTFVLQEDACSIADMAQSRQILCAQDTDGVLTGYVMFRKKNNQVVWISGLYVVPIYQRKGIGLLLLDAVEQYARVENCKIVALETHEKAIWAINFYLRATYEVANDKLFEVAYKDVLDYPPVGQRPVLVKIIKD
ncbi:MAG TPA: GNAT family N-acetyltransferase [Alphaproteobacteria bacterium]